MRSIGKSKSELLGLRTFCAKQTKNSCILIVISSFVVQLCVCFFFTFLYNVILVKFIELHYCIVIIASVNVFVDC